MEGVWIFLTLFLYVFAGMVVVLLVICGIAGIIYMLTRLQKVLEGWLR